MSASPPTSCDESQDRSVVVSLNPQELELRADLDARNIHLLRQKISELEAALETAQTRGEQHAEALMCIARSCDDQRRVLETQHATALVKLDAAHATIVAKLKEASSAKDATIAELRAEVASLKAHQTANAAQLTDALAGLAAIRTAVTSGLALEILPIRPDRRQFAAWHPGPVPRLPAAHRVRPMTFDRAWCAVVCQGKSGWKMDIDTVSAPAYGMCSATDFVTLRSAGPLPRRRTARQLQAYRVVIEMSLPMYLPCSLGFIPSHCGGPTADVVAPTADYDLCSYGGWFVDVWVIGAEQSAHCASESDTASESDSDLEGCAVSARAALTGWEALQPAGAAADNVDSVSAYATTAKVPRLPSGGAVEFAVDYAAGTCRVAFYTPAAVVGGFLEAPYAKMELRFVATEPMSWKNIPARSVPTAANSSIRLYPAVAAQYTAGATWRFAGA